MLMDFMLSRDYAGIAMLDGVLAGAARPPGGYLQASRTSKRGALPGPYGHAVQKCMASMEDTSFTGDGDS